MSKLKDLRVSAGLSQCKLAELSGVSFRMISKYETGEKDINMAASITVFKLAQSLKCCMEDLIEKDLI